jgi:hypothetical protein
MFFFHSSHPYAGFEKMSFATERQQNKSSFDEKGRLQPIQGSM